MMSKMQTTHQYIEKKAAEIAATLNIEEPLSLENSLHSAFATISAEVCKIGPDLSPSTVDTFARKDLENGMYEVERYNRIHDAPPAD